MQAGHEHHRWRLCGIPDAQGLAAKDANEFIVHCLDDLLARVKRFRLCCPDRMFTNAIRYRSNHLNIDVSVEQSRTNFTHDLIDVGFSKATLTPKSFGNSV